MSNPYATIDHVAAGLPVHGNAFTGCVPKSTICAPVEPPKKRGPKPSGAAKAAEIAAVHSKILRSNRNILAIDSRPVPSREVLAHKSKTITRATGAMRTA